MMIKVIGIASISRIDACRPRLARFRAEAKPFTAKIAPAISSKPIGRIAGSGRARRSTEREEAETGIFRYASCIASRRMFSSESSARPSSPPILPARIT